MSARELDALVAEKVMGLKVIGIRRVMHLHDGGEIVLDDDDPPSPSDAMEPCYSDRAFDGAEYENENMVPHYSTTGDGMLAVVEAMRGKGFAFRVAGPWSPPAADSWAWKSHIDFKDGTYEAYFYTPESMGDINDRTYASDLSLPRAVCLAALKACGWKGEA